jgi:hypothetical protein
MAEKTRELAVEAKNPQYYASMYVWNMIRDFVSGSAQVKRQNTLYLPIPAAMTSNKTAPDAATQQAVRSPKEIGGFVPSSTKEEARQIGENIPWYYPGNLPYESYLRRARVPDITSFAVRGLLGVATRKKPTVNLPASLKYLEERATPDGFDIYEMFNFMVSEILQVGRVGLLLNVTSDNKFIFNLYSAESAINWKEEVDSGVRRLSFTVLQEDAECSDNIFSHDTEAKFLVIRRDGSGNYGVDIYEQDQEGDDPIESKEMIIFGKYTQEMPFAFAGSVDTTPDVDESPMQGIADIANHIYMKEADLANSEFMTCNPMFVVTGAESSDAPQAIGSNTMFMISNPEAKAGYPKTDTSGLKHVLDHINRLFDEAAKYGASLMRSDTKGVESAETTRLNQSVGGATMQSAVLSAGKAIEDLLNLAIRWSGGKGTAEFTPSTEFANVQLSSEEMTALIKAHMQGTISLPTLVENWRRAGILQDGDTVDDEIERLEEEMANSEEDDLETADNDDDDVTPNEPGDPGDGLDSELED